MTKRKFDQRPGKAIPAQGNIAVDRAVRLMRKLERDNKKPAQLWGKYGGILDAFDWHFFDCPDDEVRECYFYECLRGTRVPLAEGHRFFLLGPALLSELLSKSDFLEQDILPEQLERRFENAEEIHNLLRLPVLLRGEIEQLLQPPWPDVPWQRLPREVRSSRKKHVKPVGNFVFTSSPEQFSKFGRMQAPVLNEEDAPMGVLGFFHPGVRPKEVVERFAVALEEFAERHSDVFEKDDLGKGGYKTGLKQLGALRLYCLKEHIGVKERSFEADELWDLIERQAEDENLRLPRRWMRHSGRLAAASAKAFERLNKFFKPA
jgi:hypothetical protein